MLKVEVVKKMLSPRMLHVVMTALLCLVAVTVGRPVEPVPAGYIVLEDSVVGSEGVYA